MQEQSIIITTSAVEAITSLLATRTYDRLFILTDTTTEELCRPLLSGTDCIAGATTITIGAGDTHKDISTLSSVWEELSRGRGSRHSFMLCLGGGMVTDLGGFAASTFKRGIAYANIPTTLLGMVDAAVGGKTGINFGGLKNEIGVFNKAMAVIVDTNFLRTLDYPNLASGYAEMLKHALISSAEMTAAHLAFDLQNANLDTLRSLVADSIAVKERIVTEDPLERGIRKALNLGHTAGHAIESFALHSGRPVLHGYAVAWGLVCELYLSVMKTNFSTDVLRSVVSFVRENYGGFGISCDDYDQLFDYMTHDKKNSGGRINFTLLSAPGEICLDQTATRSDIDEMLDFLRENV